MKKYITYIRSGLLELLTHRFALPLMTKFRKPIHFPYTFEQLLALPVGTLGNDLALYLQKKNFRLLPNYERHDCKHIILGYEMDEAGEACMQFYFLGNRHYSFPVIMTVLLVTILMPEHWKQFNIEFNKGRSAPSFDGVVFADLVEQPTSELKKRFCTPITAL